MATVVVAVFTGCIGDAPLESADVQVCGPGAAYSAYLAPGGIAIDGTFRGDEGAGNELYLNSSVRAPAQGMEFVRHGGANHLIGAFVIPPEDDLEMTLDLFERDWIVDDFVASSGALDTPAVDCATIQTHDWQNPMSVELEDDLGLTAEASIYFQRRLRPAQMAEVAIGHRSGGLYIPFVDEHVHEEFELGRRDLPLVALSIVVAVQRRRSDRPLEPGVVSITGPQGFAWTQAVEWSGGRYHYYVSDVIEVPIAQEFLGMSTEGSWTVDVAVPGAISSDAVDNIFLNFNVPERT